MSTSKAFVEKVYRNTRAVRLSTDWTDTAALTTVRMQ